MQVGDTILTLNGTKLVDCNGGINAWVTLFSAFGSGERELVVHRSIVVPQTQNNNDQVGAPQQLSAAQPMPSAAAAAASSTNELKQPYDVDQEILPVVTLKDDDEDQNQTKVSAHLHLNR